MRYKAIMLSLDTAVLDTVRDMGDSIDEALGDLGLDRRKKAFYKERIHLSLEEILGSALEEEHSGALEKALKRFMGIYRFARANHTRVQGGIYDLFQMLASEKTPHALVANKPDWYVLANAGHWFPKWPFSFAGGAREGEGFGSLICRAAESMAIPPPEILFVTDSPQEAALSKSFGFCTAGALWSGEKKKAFLEAGAQKALPKPKAALVALDGINLYDL